MVNYRSPRLDRVFATSADPTRRALPVAKRSPCSSVTSALALAFWAMASAVGCANPAEPAAKSAEAPSAGVAPALAPSAENALAAEEALAQAMRDNDPDGIERCLSDDWIVVSARGGVGEGKALFPEGIKSGSLKHTAYDVSEPRVRLYGDIALVTTKVHNAGTARGKSFDVMERQTDVWRWRDGRWECILTHEAWEGAEKDQKQLAG